MRDSNIEKIGLVVLLILVDLAFDIMTALIIFGVWVTPMWFNIVLSVLLGLSCGVKCSIIKLARVIMTILILVGAWVAPLWVKIVLVVLMVTGIGNDSSDV